MAVLSSELREKLGTTESHEEAVFNYYEVEAEVVDQEYLENLPHPIPTNIDNAFKYGFHTDLSDLINRDEDDGDDPLLLADEKGRIANTAAIIDVMDVTSYSPIRAEALTQVNYGCEGGDVFVEHRSNSLVASMMDQVDPDSSIAIISIVVRDRDGDEIPLQGAITVDGDRIVWEHAILATIVNHVLASGSLASIVLK